MCGYGYAAAQVLDMQLEVDKENRYIYIYISGMIFQVTLEIILSDFIDVSVQALFI